MNRVEQFLQHGLLPFVGRGEIERILNFWRGTVESQHLRAFLFNSRGEVEKVDCYLSVSSGLRGGSCCSRKVVSGGR
ncbi:MAG: hypothetical protein H6616_00230 [Ignavibacteria bacterium]|nr:hypothetical protein [Ignavibacteria bacterium]